MVDGADRVLASCGAPSVKPEAGWADVGYWVAPEARGHGVATKAVRVLAGWLIESVGLRTVVLEIEESNAASLAVARAAGFVQTPSVHWEEHRGTTRPFTLWRFE